MYVLLCKAGGGYDLGHLCGHSALQSHVRPVWMAGTQEPCRVSISLLFLKHPTPPMFYPAFPVQIFSLIITVSYRTHLSVCAHVDTN